MIAPPRKPARRLLSIFVLLLPVMLATVIAIGPRGHWAVLLSAGVLSLWLPYVVVLVLSAFPPTKRMLASKNWAVRAMMRYFIIGSAWWGLLLLVVPQVTDMAKKWHEHPLLVLTIAVGLPVVLSVGVDVGPRISRHGPNADGKVDHDAADGSAGREER